MTVALHYGRLTAPAADGGVLIEPASDLLRSALADAAPAPEVVLAGQPLAAYRSVVRAGLGLTGPVVALGHQPEFYHAGVWAKHVVADVLSRSAGQPAVHLWVDHDKVRRPGLVVPVGRDDRIRQVAIPLAGWDAPSYESMRRWTSAQFDGLEAACRDAGYLTPLMTTYLEAAAATERARDWVDQHIGGIAAVDRTFGMQLTTVRASTAPLGPFVCDLLANARRFATAYNGALAAVRRLIGVRGTRHPVPDLEVEARRVELPLWVVQDGGRARLRVAEDATHTVLLAGDRPVQRFASDLLAHWTRMPEAEREWIAHAVRPRALALTLWARLVLSDLFVHGIGGAKYDRITDRIFTSFYGIDPPPMAAVSATLCLDGYAPDAAGDDATPALRRALRDLRYNPQRYVSASDHGALIARRSALIGAAIELRRVQPPDRRARRVNFDALRQVNAELAQVAEVQAATVRQRLEDLAQRRRSAAILSSREYFFCFMAPERLRALQGTLVATAMKGSDPGGA